MTIDGVEYKNVYRLSTKKDFMYNYCMVCEKQIGNKNYHLEGSIFLLQPLRDTPTYFPVCTDCVSTPEKAEKVIIPLLKILNGGRIQVFRYTKKEDIKTIFRY